jgi:hypothetical protein
MRSKAANPKVSPVLIKIIEKIYWIHDDIMKTALEQAHEK